MFFDDIFEDLDDIADDLLSGAKKVTKKAVNMTTQPIRDTLEIIDGLTEGELRHKAALRLGVDVASGMAVSELIEWYEDEE